MEKRKRKNLMIGIILTLVLVGLAALPFIIEKAEERSGSSTSNVISATAKMAEIQQTLSGTGTLTEEDAEDVELPSGVEVTKYLVSNGDAVVKGQALATVDRVSVMAAIADCQDSIDYLETELSYERDNAGSSYVVTPAIAYVKTIYAQVGDYVQDVMLEHGCLAVLEINGEEWKAVAYTGRVHTINMHEGEYVDANTAIFYFKETGDRSAYDGYVEQQNEYADMLEDLVQMYQDGVIIAPCDGVIEGIDTDAAEELNSSTDKYVIGDGLSATGDAGLQAQSLVMDSDVSLVLQTLAAASNGSETYALGQISLYDEASGVLEVTITDLDGQYVVKDNLNFTEFGFSTISQGQQYVFKTSDKTNFTAVYLVSGSTTPSGNQGFPKNTGDLTDEAYEALMKQMQGSMSGSSSGASSSTTTTEEEEFELYSLDTTVLMTVTPQNTITITMTVDELDILSVSLGQEAQMTIDALPGHAYTGSVTSIDRVATNSGGNTKYTAEITLDRDETMLAGMNASSTIVLSTTENVLTVPAAALNDHDSKTYVYTEYDAATGTLGGEKEVETGTSDGENVQILSGLAEGDTVYYTYVDTISIDSLAGGMSGGSASSLFSSLTGSSGSSFGGGGMGGGMPGGGGHSH